MKAKSFFDFYEEEKSKPTAAQVFVSKMANLTHRSENTVRMWLAGQQTPGCYRFYKATKSERNSQRRVAESVFP